MTTSSRRLLALLLLLAAVGCHRCGDRPRLFSRLRDRNPDDDDRTGVDRFRDTIRDPARDPARDPCCDDVLPAPRRAGFDGAGHALGGGTGRFVSPLSGMPYGDPVPLGGYPPAGTGMPYGTPIRIGPAREDELPPANQFIPSPSVPLAPMRPTGGDTKLIPPLGGGVFTGEPRK